MKTDVQIAQECKMLPIGEIADKVGIDHEDLDLYGKYKAKVSLDVFKKLKDKPDGKLILVTAINPTPAGEGKTTTSVGLSLGLNKIGKKSVVALREPSLGPCFGVKGGAAGGGYAQLVPMSDLNLHFTGDFHAVTTAHNLLSALLDNHIHQGNELDFDLRNITWRRVLDMNDRALRQIVVSLGPTTNGVPRTTGFDITTASEIMAILCLSTSLDNLKERLGRIVVGYNTKGDAIYARDLKGVGSMALLLKDALMPNLVQTTENTPAFIHGGPFANIAHGANTVLATQMALKLSDYIVTEGGFGGDLGAEKFYNIVCRAANLKPVCCVIVATARALKCHGGVDYKESSTENLQALEKGLGNLEQHIENMSKFGVPSVVAINEFPTDTKAEVDLIEKKVAAKGANVVLSQGWAKGGEGTTELAKKVVEVCDSGKANFKPLYDVNDSIEAKVNKVATEIYRADGVDFTPLAKQQAETLAKLGLDKLPICVAKTQYSFSDNPKLLGAPRGFRITVKELKVSNGAGFIVVLTGDIMTMPGLPKEPAANRIDVDNDGTIVGLF